MTNQKSNVSLITDGDKITTLEKSQGDIIGEKKAWEDAWLKVKEANLIAQGSSVSEPYQTAWVYRAVSVIATNIAQAAFKVYYSNKQPYPESTDVVQLFENPNPLQSYFEWMENLISFLLLKGETFIYMNPSIGQRIGTANLPAELYVLNPDLVKHSFENGQLAGWTYGNMPIEPDEIIHFKNFNPIMNSFRGFSPITALRYEMESDFSAAKYNNVFFKNQANPSGVIEADTSAGIDISDLRKMKKMWNENHGTTENAHRTAFLLNGMRYRQIGLSQRDMEFLEGRRFSRESIMAIFGVNSFTAGFMSDGTITRASALANMRSFYENTLYPLMMRIEQKIKSKFFMRHFNDGSFGKFCLAELPVYKSVFNEDMLAAKDMFSIGYTRHEINQRLNLLMPENDPDGNIRYLPMNLIPVGQDEYNPLTEDSQKSISKNVKNERFMQTIQKNYLKIQAEMEKLFESKLKRYFFEKRKEALKILNEIKKSLTPEEEIELMALLNGLFNNDELKITVEPIYRQSAQAAGEMALANIGVSRAFTINERILNSRLNYIKGITDTLFESLRSDIYEGIKQGETINSITDRVKHSFTRNSNRAKIIARTETASLMSAQTQDTYQSEGIKMKAWLATPDEKTRETHLLNQQQGPIPMNSSFNNGLMFPGDSANDPSGGGETINCRCSLIPIMETE